MRRARRMVWAGAVVCLMGCSGAQSEASGATSASGDEVFARWSLPGVTLFRSCHERHDDSTCGVWGRDDATGRRLDGRELFGRLPTDLDASSLAERAQDLLLGASGEAVLTPELAARHPLVSAPERSIITPPRIEGGSVIFYALEGEMSPTATELRVDRASGVVTRQPVIEIWVERAPASEGPLCLPITTCHCPSGCATVDRVALPDGGQRYRRTDGRTPRILYRVEESGAVQALNEPCEESCRPEPLDYGCAMLDGACAQGPLTAATP